MTRWTFGAASVRGISHIKNGTRLQDAKRCFEVIGPNGAATFCAVVSDGAGSASHGGQGASLVCRTMAEALRSHFSSETMEMPSEDDIWDWVDQARDRITHAASLRSLSPRDFASTMVLAVSDGRDTLTAHIGDGAIVARERAQKSWHVLSGSENGEYASTTYFITDSGTPRLRVARHDVGIDALFLFSDGIENQVLDSATDEPHEAFFTPMARPFSQSNTTGRDHHLSGKLAAYLDSEKFAEHTDDDKTLVIAVRK